MSIGRLTVLILLLLGACAPLQFPEPPEVTLVGLEPLDAGLFEQRMSVTLRIENRNPTAMPVDGLRFALELNGKPFAKGLSNQSVTVPRLGDATIAGVATLHTTDLIRQAMGIPNATGLQYRVSGTLFVPGTMGLDFDQTGDFDGLIREARP
jgi:LEA14-like dessication related protein